MLETFYNNFGFIGSLVVSLFLFLFFIFWMAGVAGICKEKEGEKTTTTRLVFAVLIPLYPVIWIISEMIAQRKKLKRL
ncbi:MAG: hypothetical protein R6V27_10070 [Balneolaceae bacterium]